MWHIIIERLLLPVNLILGTVVFSLVYRIYLRPRISSLDPRQVLTPILLLNSMRHLGLMFLAPGATAPGIPPDFAVPAAVGDLVTAILALIALYSLRRNLPATPVLVGLFNIVGFTDLLSAITLASIFNAPAFMGAAYWIPAFWVPLLLVTHGAVFVLLSRNAFGRSASSPSY